MLKTSVVVLAATLLLLPLSAQSQTAPRAAMAERCEGAWSQLADRATETVDPQDAADLLGEEFVTAQSDMSRTEFMSACMASMRKSVSGASTGEGGTRSDDDGK